MRTIITAIRNDAQDINLATILRRQGQAKRATWGSVPTGAAPRHRAQFHRHDPDLWSGKGASEQCFRRSGYTCASSMLLATPGSSRRSRQPRPSALKDKARSSPLCVKCVQPSQCRWYNQRIWKRMRRLDHVVAVHGQVKRAPGPRRTREGQHHRRSKPASHLSHAVIPDGLAGDVERPRALIVGSDHEPDHISRQRLDTAGSCRAGVAAIHSARRSGVLSSTLVHGARPGTPAPRRLAPASVVTTRAAMPRKARPAWSKLSACWS
jgi:hypothetical protein